MYKPFKWISLSLVTVWITGCSLLGSDSNQPIATNSTSAVLLKDTNELTRLPSDALTIQTATIEKDILKIEVAYGGGCREHEFALYVMPYLAESYPPQGGLVLTHNGNQDMCKAIVIKHLEFDLSPIKDFFHSEKSIIFSLTSNGAKESYKERLEYKP